MDKDKMYGADTLSTEYGAEYIPHHTYLSCIDLAILKSLESTVYRILQLRKKLSHDGSAELKSLYNDDGKEMPLQGTSSFHYALLNPSISVSLLNDIFKDEG